MQVVSFGRTNTLRVSFALSVPAVMRFERAVIAFMIFFLSTASVDDSSFAKSVFCCANCSSSSVCEARDYEHTTTSSE